MRVGHKCAVEGVFAMKRAYKEKKISVFKPLDALVALAVFAVAAVCMLAMFFRESGDLKAVVRQDGKIIKEVELQTVQSPYLFPVKGDIPLIILFESDGACVKSSECRDKICVNTGKLTRAGQMAICLPARVTLELQSVEGTENTPDAIMG